MEPIDNPLNNSMTFKPPRKLPKYFFEKILELELKIKREFSLDRLKDLVNLYSMAVEYYESIEDKRHRDYQNRLNVLLSQPEILKKMNEYILNRNSNTDQIDQTKKIQTEMKKKQMKQKINYYMNQINVNRQNSEVNKILQEIKKETKDDTVGVNEIVNEEIHKQENNFKSKLEQRRKKHSIQLKKKHSQVDKISNLLETNLLENKENIQKYRIRRYLTIQNGSLMSNISKISFHENTDINDFQIPIEEENKSVISEKKSSNKSIHENDNETISNQSQENAEKSDNYLEQSLEKYEDNKMSELDDMFRNIDIREPNVNVSNINYESKLIHERTAKGKNSNEVDSKSGSMIVKDSVEIQEGTETNLEVVMNNSVISKNSKSKEINTSIFKIDDSILESKHIGPKHRQIFLEIKEALEQFVNEFNFYFYEYVFQRFAEQIQRLMDEKYQKYVEVSKNYQSQIKEMEFLIHGVDSEDQHRDGIISIVEALKEEQEQELERIEDHYDKLVIEAQNNFKNISFKNNPGVQLIEEKFKLDLYNLINLIISPYKSLNKYQV